MAPEYRDVDRYSSSALGGHDGPQAARIFALIPNSSPQSYQIELHDGSKYWYNQWDPCFFSTCALNLDDALYLSDAEVALFPYIFHLWKYRPSYMTFNRLMLYLQIRDAEIIFDIRQKERSLQRRDAREARRQGVSIHDEMIRNLPNVSFQIDVEYIPRDHRECLICQEEFEKEQADGTPAENALKLPCGHIYGEDCLQEWIRNWDHDDGSNFTLCTLCRDDFGLTPVLDDEDDEEGLDFITDFDPHPGLASPWFVQWLRYDPNGHPTGFGRGPRFP